MIAEIVTDGNKEMISTHLQTLEGRLPVAIESLDWGWGTNDDTAPEINQSLKQDPLAKLKPEVGQITFTPSKKTLLTRYILMLSLTVTLISLLIAKFYLERSFTLDMTYAIVFMVWLFSLNEVPLDLRRYIAKIECNQTNVEITSWIRKKAVNIDWQEIWGMEYSYSECRLYTHEGIVRFLLNTGITRKETMLKTIIERSSLNFVETDFRKTVYKRYDAPDDKK